MKFYKTIMHYLINKVVKTTAVFLVAASIVGCATDNYSKNNTDVFSIAATGKYTEAISLYTERNKSIIGSAPDLLNNLELGELHRLNGDIKESTAAWNKADEKIEAWENESRLNVKDVAGNVGSFLMNDSKRTYDGKDFEKTIISTRLALNYIAEKDFQSARVKIVNVAEREELIATLREKAFVAAEEEAKAKGATTKFDPKDIKGYPFEIFDDPAVKKLRNGYQNAFAWYLTGFIHEALREPSLATPAYQKALQINPDVQLFKTSLNATGRTAPQRISATPAPIAAVVTTQQSKNSKAVTSKSTARTVNGKSLLSKNSVTTQTNVATENTVTETQATQINAKSEPSAAQSGITDTLIIVETGWMEKMASMNITTAFSLRGKARIATYSYPIMRDDNKKLRSPSSMKIDTRTISLTEVGNYDALAKRSLQDDLPFIYARGVVRAIVKVGAQELAEHSPLGELGSLAVGIAGAAIEVADTRQWQFLPARISVARIPLSSGNHVITIGNKSFPISINGSHDAVLLRVF
jgi:hypothetical protein